MFFKRQKVGEFNLKTDIHSHILPGIDDGSKNAEESLEILTGLEKAGVETVWFTPHVKEDRYPNTFDSVQEAFGRFGERVATEGLNVQLGVAAEYYIGPRFLKLLESGERLLTMKDKYLLVEVSMHQESMFIFDTLYEICQMGYIPILAHPERYVYYHGREEIFGRLRRQGCMMQLNIFSLAGYYGKDVKKAAQRLVKEKLYDFTATDIHHPSHLAILPDKDICKVLNEYHFKNDMLSLKA